MARRVHFFVLKRSDVHRCLPLSRSERRASARVTAVASSTDIATDASLPQGDGTRNFAEDAESEHSLSFVVSEAAPAQESTGSVSVVSRLLASFYYYTSRTSVLGTLLCSHFAPKPRNFVCFFSNFVISSVRSEEAFIDVLNQHTFT